MANPIIYAAMLRQRNPTAEVYEPFWANVELLINAEGPVGSTNAVDSSSRARTITTVGNIALSDTQSRFGSTSFYFDGTGDYLSLASSSGFAFGTADFCVEYWVFPTSYPGSGNRTLGFATSGNITNFDFAIGYTGFPLVWNGSAVALNGSQQVPLNQWSHVAFARAAGVLRIFVNGVMQGSTSSATAFSNTAQVQIGSTSSYNGGPFFMDGIRVTKGAARYATGSSFSAPSQAFSYLA